MSDGIFISYRRDDAAGEAGRIHDRLQSHFGEGRLFIDVDAVPLGSDFLAAIESALQQSRALLAVMGPSWLSAQAKAGGRRLNDPKDVVRAELAIAIKLGIPIIPVLLDNTQMPTADDLPDDIKTLSLRNALHARHSSFHTDISKLIAALENLSARELRPKDLPLSQFGKPYRYLATISYSHLDRPTAVQMHRSLERYRVPRELVGQVGRRGQIPRSLHPIFREDEELPSSADLSEGQQTAIRESNALIMLCSLATGHSMWSNAEAEVLIKAGRPQDIIPVVIQGSIAPGQESPFPPVLRGHVNAGKVRFIDARTLSPKARLHATVARLIGVSTSRVLAIERRRSRRHAVALTVLAVGVVALIAAYFFAR